jgi:hypothetical protein
LAPPKFSNGVLALFSDIDAERRAASFYRPAKRTNPAAMHEGSVSIISPPSDTHPSQLADMRALGAQVSANPRGGSERLLEY